VPTLLRGLSVTLYFDGLCEPKNPGGIATYGFVIFKSGKKIMEGHGLACKPWSPEATNNVAEYRGLLEGLKWLAANGFVEEVEVRGDSQLVIKQMTGKYKVRAERIKPIYDEAKKISLIFKNLQFTWIPRQMNEAADLLSRQAYSKYSAFGKDSDY
jgi:ribonuclease HI